MTITGITWLDFLIWVGIGASFSIGGYLIGRVRKMDMLTDALDVLTEKYIREVQDHYRTRIQLAKLGRLPDDYGRLPDDYAD